MTPHFFCIANPFLAWLTVLFDLLIMIAYFTIPISLMALYAARPRSGRWVYSIRSTILVLFAGFIFFCGMSHLMDALTMFVPAYWPAAIVKGITAGISLTTSYVMFHRREKLLSFPSKLETEHEELESLRKRIALLVQNS